MISDDNTRNGLSAAEILLASYQRSLESALKQSAFYKAMKKKDAFAKKQAKHYRAEVRRYKRRIPEAERLVAAWERLSGGKV